LHTTLSSEISIEGQLILLLILLPLIRLSRPGGSPVSPAGKQLNQLRNHSRLAGASPLFFFSNENNSNALIQ